MYSNFSIRCTTSKRVMSMFKKVTFYTYSFIVVSSMSDVPTRYYIQFNDDVVKDETVAIYCAVLRPRGSGAFAEFSSVKRRRGRLADLFAQ